MSLITANSQRTISIKLFGHILREALRQKRTNERTYVKASFRQTRLILARLVQTRKFTAATNIYRWHLAKICAGNIHRRILMKVVVRFDRGPRVCLCLRCPLIHRVEQRRSNMFIAFPHFVDFLPILAQDSNVNSLLPAWLRANIFVRLLNNCGNMDTRVIYTAFVPSERMFDK